MLAAMADPLRNLRVLITGATSGIGELLVPLLAARGATVLVHGRDPLKAGQIAAAAQGATQPFIAPLDSLASVAQLAREVVAAGPLDVLVNNAGIGFGSDRNQRELSADGFELRFAVNYLAPFLLTELLTGHGLPSRAVINVASAGQAALDHDDLMNERSYDGVLAYRRSKLALISDTFQRAAHDSKRAYLSLHPGTFLATKMVREANIAPQGSAESGAAVVLFVIEQALSGKTGQYFDRHSAAPADPSASDAAQQTRLREAALRLTAPFRQR